MSSGLCGWLVVCWLVADRPWNVLLERQLATDINRGTASVYRNAAKTVACWSGWQQTTVLHHKASVCCDLIGYWTQESPVLLGDRTVSRWEGRALKATDKPAFWSRDAVGEEALREPKWTVSSLHIRAPWLVAIQQTCQPLAGQPCCFAVDSNGWLLWCCLSLDVLNYWPESHAILLLALFLRITKHGAAHAHMDIRKNISERLPQNETYAHFIARKDTLNQSKTRWHGCIWGKTALVHDYIPQLDGKPVDRLDTKSN